MKEWMQEEWRGVRAFAQGGTALSGEVRLTWIQREQIRVAMIFLSCKPVRMEVFEALPGTPAELASFRDFLQGLKQGSLDSAVDRTRAFLLLATFDKESLLTDRYFGAFDRLELFVEMTLKPTDKSLKKQFAERVEKDTSRIEAAVAAKKPQPAPPLDLTWLQVLQAVIVRLLMTLLIFNAGTAFSEPPKGYDPRFQFQPIKSADGRKTTASFQPLPLPLTVLRVL